MNSDGVAASGANKSRSASQPAAMRRIVILGGGFGGVYTARSLERLLRCRPDVEIVLVSRDNFLLMTPLLFEVFSGTLDTRHCSFPLRAFLRTTRFGEAAVRGIDLERRVVYLAGAGGEAELAYDHLVLALGALTNRVMIQVRNTLSRSKRSPTPSCSAITLSSASSGPTWKPIRGANADYSRSSSSAAAWSGSNCSAS